MMQQQTPYRGFRVYLGSTLFFIFIVIIFSLAGSINILLFWTSFSFHYTVSLQGIHLILWAAKFFCGITYEVEGLENLPKNKAAIILSKHQSAWETIALRAFLPKQTVLLKRSVLWIPLGGWGVRTLRPIAIDRNKPRQALKILLKEGKQALDDGLWVLIFPEGTRTSLDEQKKFNAGGAILAYKTGYPVIPLAHNAGRVWPRYSFLKYPGIIKVKIGKPIEIKAKKPKEINIMAEAWIKQAMANL